MEDFKKSKRETFEGFARRTLGQLAYDIVQLQKNMVALMRAAKVTDKQMEKELEKIGKEMEKGNNADTETEKSV